MTAFANYNNTVISAFTNHPKPTDIVNRKVEIMDRLSEYYNRSFDSILFVGFNPAITNLRQPNIYCTEVTVKTKNKIKEINPSVSFLDSVDRKFDLVITGDEFFTFADSEDQQRTAIQKYCAITSGVLITTLRDYKNLDFRSREFSEPAIIKNNDLIDVYNEIHSWDAMDRYSFQTYLYHMNNVDASFLGMYKRRTLFFKQLAKISSDAGAVNFVVHKNLMYKSLLKKNYEHVITIEFE